MEPTASQTSPLTPREDSRIHREQEFHDQRFAHDVARAPARKFYALDVGAKKRYLALIQENCSGKKILEYGCGPGGNALALARAGAIMTAIDISPVAIQRAETEARSAGIRVDYKVMNAEAMSFPDQSFDLICGSGILHHLDLARAFSEIRRTLHPNGAALFLEPMGHNPFITLYRKMTPQMRSRDEHPLHMVDLRLARSYFLEVQPEFFNLFTLFAAPLPSGILQEKILWALGKADQLLFQTAPIMRRYAWMTVIRLAKPVPGFLTH